MFKLIKSKTTKEIYYIMKDDIEIGSMIRCSGEWVIRLHRSVNSLEYYGIWLITQDEIKQLDYYERNK